MNEDRVGIESAAYPAGEFEAYAAGLFATPVVVATAFVGELDFEELPQPVRSVLPDSAAAARRAEFAAGRLAAKRASVGLTGRARWMGADAHGAPTWPHGVTGSISHCAWLAACAMGIGDGVGLGLDLEPCETGGRLFAAAHYVCTPEERQRIDSVADPARALARLFSAKEAAFKALPPDAQAELPLRSVALSWHEPSAADATVVFRTDGRRIPAGEVRCALFRGLVVAGAVIPALPSSTIPHHPDRIVRISSMA